MEKVGADSQSSYEVAVMSSEACNRSQNQISACVSKEVALVLVKRRDCDRRAMRWNDVRSRTIQLTISHLSLQLLVQSFRCDDFDGE